MQENSIRRSNRERTQATRTALIAAARKLFVEKGFADTGTPEIVAKANVTRGALYHHFADKTDLFRAVVMQEAQAISTRIRKETGNPASALNTLVAGAEAYFAAMAVEGRARLLLVDGPAILGHIDMDQVDKETGGEELHQGLMIAVSQGMLNDAPLDALTALLSAAFDRAALAISQGGPEEDYKAAIRLIITGLLGCKPQ
ncbi:MAG: TetR/AcrR family transcriptional regulator [Alphaproteobacteria bacterium]|nr:TetR/AcrR family transcriptional regulator [Alphaproteobacteria bacterium]